MESVLNKSVIFCSYETQFLKEKKYRGKDRSIV